jgi:hypothetical protein
MCVVPILLVLLIANELVSGLRPLSSKDLAIQLQAHHIPADRTFLYHGMKRSLRHSLNFYLHKEVPDWDQNPEHEGYVVSESFNCAHLKKQGFECTDVLLGSSASDWFVSHVTPRNSADQPASRGKAQQKE